MIRRAILLVLALSSVAYSQGGGQPRLPIHTLVREDIFAGFLFGDMERFQIGLSKVDEILKENPQSAPALAWRGGGELYLAVRAHEAGDAKAFHASYDKAKEYFEKALASGPNDPGVFAVSGGSYVVFGDRLPAAERQEAWQQARRYFKKLEEGQKNFIDQLPVHLKGELLAALAQSAQRVGETEDSTLYLKRIVDSLPGTPYETRAKKWLEDPQSASKSSLTCQTCHDPGRLKNRLAALQQN
jgi:tetratricopeptide (TPR) repeat protein